MLFFIIRFKTVGSNLPQPATAGYLRRHAKAPLRVQEICCRPPYPRQAYNDTAIFTGSAARRQSNTTKHDNRCDTVSPTCHTDCTHGSNSRACTLQNCDLQQNDMPDRGGAIFPPHVSARICPMTRSNNITCFRALLHFLLHLQS